ncbi:DUF2867 domain-containing protein [Rathayibacter iranicus]|uniref:DUF1990 domain-containing protein n=2 Tax=Rathayibacter iranicus TaxID=59737 RepID=A0AAD1AFG8_9MICO|nr:DUF2867 domain-containing protein [Rathayibacter iranicus]AZZ57203.1 hypothetical protein C7V51_15995 [Rathayibacter iranicus]MWV29841.1 DUF2867 domain-containing protein [Rathayibacter iranicus NCPPB 2253 = VKM Ac-1602]PPI41229.1 hypothetical protein C5E09_14860 [Rathayibacter iranicus]PPI57475.1 hypothetical protein C5E08_15750 [Rathayibacter iranicus]PPI68221.1 hypothetical protein C5E01_14800 [Rathayibacter iranicus]
MSTSKRLDPLGEPNQVWREGTRIPGGELRTARFWGEALFAPKPLVVVAALRMRNAVGRIVGIKPFADDAGVRGSPRADRLGPFPVLAETPEHIAFGIADKHLTFRSSLRVSAGDGVVIIDVETKVWTHNWFGRCYAAGLRIGHPAVMTLFLRALRRSHHEEA